MILRRYILKEHLAPFLFSFAVIMFLLVVDLILQMIDLILGKGVPREVVFEMFFLNTAWMAALAAPMAVLVGTLMAFGRLSRDREIVAMQAAGVGVHRVVWPVLLAGVGLAVLLVVFNDRVLPEFNHRARLLMSDIQRKRPAVALKGREGVVIRDFENFRILIGDIDPTGSVLRDVVIYSQEPGKYPVTMVARRGDIRFNEATDEALLTLYEGESHQVDEEDPEVYVRAWFERRVLRLGEAGRRLYRTVSQYRTDREMGVGAMWERVGQYESEARKLRADAAVRVGDFFRVALLDTPSVKPYRTGFEALRGRLEADRSLVEHKLRSADRYRVEIHKKFSIPAACVVFILVGAPLGVRIRGSGPAIGAGISIGFFLIYWMCLIGGEKLADRGFVAPWVAMWSPNLLLALGGGALSVRTFFEWTPGRRKQCGS